MKPLPTKPQAIVGTWDDGYALDLQTLSSEFLGEDEYGHAVFDTKRSEVGESLYQLKYKQDASRVDVLAATAAEVVKEKGWGPEVLVPVPATKDRAVAPVPLVGAKLAGLLGIGFEPDAVKRTKQTPELKNVFDFGERQKLLADAHTMDPAKIKGRRVLLFDDLFRSGATMNAVSALLKSGGAAKIFALALTRTRRSR